MQQIHLQQIYPLIFEDKNLTSSGIWKKDIVFEKGRRYLINAPSGGGKTSLLAFIFGIRKDYSGTIDINGKDIRNFSLPEWDSIRSEKLSMVFQNLKIFTELTAWENLQLKNTLTGKPYRNDDFLNHWLHQLGIADKKHRPASQISFGQRQRLALIRSLCQPFDFLLLDEPFSHLDTENASLICRELDLFLKDSGAGLIMTSLGDIYPVSDLEILNL